MFTRPHHNALAAALKEAVRQADSVEVGDGARIAVECVRDMLARYNPRFDRDRFMAACGLQPNGKPEFHPGHGGYHGVT